MSPALRKVLLVSACLSAIAASVAWIYFREYRAPKHDIGLHRRAGETMAELTAKVVGPRGRILYVTIPTGREPELHTQLEAFVAALKRLGEYELKEERLDPKHQPKYGLGNGLSARRFVRLVKKREGFNVIVSFIGAPKLSDADLAELKTVPKFIAECRSVDDLPKLFEKHLLDGAVVSRFVFPAPGPLKSRTSQEWFDKRYQILTAEAAKSIPSLD